MTNDYVSKMFLELLRDAFKLLWPVLTSPLTVPVSTFFVVINIAFKLILQSSGLSLFITLLMMIPVANLVMGHQNAASVINTMWISIVLVLMLLALSYFLKSKNVK